MARKDDIAKLAGECIDRIRRILSEARAKALQTVNAAMIAAYWHIGREIVDPPATRVVGEGVGGAGPSSGAGGGAEIAGCGRADLGASSGEGGYLG